jgi:hypothetical protein
MEKKFSDVRDMPDAELYEVLINLLVDRYMEDPTLAREFIRERLEREQSWNRRELLEGLYDEGYWS